MFCLNGKDGIRRTLMTTSGCATERHFNEEDLRKMFSLKPKGVCEMLDITKRVKEPIGSFHEVVGVSSHDSVYFRTVINVDCRSEESPFAGTPLRKIKKIGRSARALSATQETSLISEMANINLSPSHPKGQPGAVISQQHNMEKSTCMPREDYSDKENKKVEMQQYIKEKPLVDSNSRFNDMIEIANELTASGKIEESLLLLLKLLEYEDLKGDQRLLVHKKVSSRAVLYFQWHKELSKEQKAVQ